MASSKNQQQYWQQVYSLEELRVSGIITKQRISQFEGGAFPSGVRKMLEDYVVITIFFCRNVI